jgi:hypothetical protein
MTEIAVDAQELLSADCRRTLPEPLNLVKRAPRPRLIGWLLLRLWQKDRQNHECDEPLAREAQKP